MSFFEAETLATLLNFFVLVGILWYAGRKPIADFFVTRSKEIGASVQEARQVSQVARASFQEWDGKARGAQSEIQAQLADAKATMAKFRESTLVRVNVESKRISDDATQVGLSEQMKAKRSLRRQVAQESLQQARLYLERHVDGKDSKKLLNDYLEKVADGHNG